MIAVQLAEKRFGALTEGHTAQIATLSSKQLTELALALLDFAALAEFDAWLAKALEQ